MGEAGDVRHAILTILHEVARGAPDTSFVLNPGDAGLLASLERLSAADANLSVDGRGSIARHVDHLRYGLSLLNRWTAGEEDPFSDARYLESWQRPPVSDEEWRVLRDRLAHEVDDWSRAIEARASWDESSLTIALSSAVHLAYHLGAIRQIHASARGPAARD